MKEASIASRLIRVTACALFIQLIICRPLWIASLRSFPTVPTLSFLPIQWGNFFDSILYATLLISCIVLFIKPFSRTAYVILALAFLLFLLEDINRLQPWFYLYLLLLSSLLFSTKKDSSHILTILRIIISSVYFWSGLQKLNVHFASEMFPWLAEFIGSQQFYKDHHVVAYVIASTEALSGILLWIPRTRKIASIIAMLMHLFIIISLGFVHKWNEVVWPWNAVFAWMVFELFFLNKPTPIRITKSVASYHTAFIILIITIMPAFNMFGYYDHFLSGGFYSSIPDEPAFYFPASEASNLPASSASYQYFLKKENKAIVLINYWSLGELKVPLYPEHRVYKEVAKKLCLHLQDTQNTGLRLSYKKRFDARQTVAEYPFDSLEAVK